MPVKRLIPNLILICAITLTACARQLKPNDCARPDVFCAGLVTDFGKVSAGINHEAWLGLQDAQATHLVDRIDYIETVDVRDRQANIDTFAEDGYDVIVTVGSSMSEETTAAATQYKKIAFIGVEQPQEKNLPNLAGLVFHEERSAFLAGALAGLVTQTGYVAAICDAKFVDAMRRYCEGFAAGARNAHPDIHVSVTYRDGPNNRLFNDPTWGASTALQQVQDGADVVFAAGGNTAAAALETAAANDAYVIGSESDVYGSLANIRPMLLTSAMNNVRNGVLDLLRQAHAEALPSGDYFGEVSLAAWHDLDRQIPVDAKQELEKIKIRLAVGAISPGVPYKELPPATEKKPRKPKAAKTKTAPTPSITPTP